MKILYFISTINRKNGGIGGHYHSLLTLTDELANKHSVCIINIGTQESELLNNYSKVKVINIINKWPNIFSIYSKLSSTIKNEQFEVFHAYDSISFFWARLMGFTFSKPVVLTKCGGINPRIYYPKSNNFILFSEENFNYFLEKNQKSNIYLIPNRISDFSQNENKIKEIKNKYNLNQYDKIFLRITRIENYYKDSMIKLANLVQKLNHDNNNVCLIFIGVVENKELKKEILTKYSNVFFIDEKKYITNAKELIDIGDFILGTGRGFMEAASLGKFMLAPSMNNQFPVLIDETNIGDAFRTNFSERYFSKISDAENYEKIKSFILNNTLKKNIYSNFMKKYAENFFLISSVINKYNSIYSEASNSNLLNFDFFLNFLFYLRKYLKK